MDSLLRAARWLVGLLILLATVGLLSPDTPLAGLLVVLGLLVIVPPSGDRIGSALPLVSRHGPALATGVALSLIGAIVGSGAGTDAGPTSPPTAAAPGSASAPPPAAAPPEAASALKPGAVAPDSGRKITEADVSAKIGPDAAFLIEGKGWDKTRKAWGSEWIKRINAAMPLAARKAAESPECDYVEVAGLSDRSSPKKNIVYYVDCRNGKRFYVTEAEAKSSGKVVSKNAKTAAIRDGDAIAACEDSVKDQLNYPLSFDRHMLDTSVYRAATGNIVVQFGFDAKNAMGAELPHRARCVIDDRGIHPAEISRR